MITDEKIPLSLDLSSLQPDNGFAQPKLKLKFSSNDKQIIQKEWTQSLFLEGKKQIPTLSYTNKSGTEINFTETVIYASLNDPVPVQVSIPDNLGLSDQFETRIEAISLDWTSGAHNNTWSPTLTVPNQAAGVQTSKNLSLKKDNSVTLASQLFYRLKGNNPWIATPNFTNYYLAINNLNIFEVKTNSLLFKKGEKLVLRFQLPENYINSKLRFVRFNIIDKVTNNLEGLYIINPDGSLTMNTANKALREKYFSNITINDPIKKLDENEEYTHTFSLQENVKETIRLNLDIDTKSSSDINDRAQTITIRLNTDKN